MRFSVVALLSISIIYICNHGSVVLVTATEEEGGGQHGGTRGHRRLPCTSKQKAERKPGCRPGDQDYETASVDSEDALSASVDTNNLISNGAHGYYQENENRFDEKNLNKDTKGQWYRGRPDRYFHHLDRGDMDSSEDLGGAGYHGDRAAWAAGVRNKQKKQQFLNERVKGTPQYQYGKSEVAEFKEQERLRKRYFAMKKEFGQHKDVMERHADDYRDPSTGRIVDRPNEAAKLRRKKERDALAAKLKAARHFMPNDKKATQRTKDHDRLDVFDQDMKNIDNYFKNHAYKKDFAARNYDKLNDRPYQFDGTWAFEQDEEEAWRNELKRQVKEFKQKEKDDKIRQDNDARLAKMMKDHFDFSKPENRDKIKVEVDKALANADIKGRLDKTAGRQVDKILAQDWEV